MHRGGKMTHLTAHTDQEPQQITDLYFSNKTRTQVNLELEI
jgi:hypothetical protein